MPNQNTPKPPGLLRAILDAIHGEDDRLGGVSVTQLTTPLTAEETGTINVETTLRFGEFEDGAGDAQVIVGGEIIYCGGRTDTSFTTLQRGLMGSQRKFHPIGTLVYDFAQNRSAIDTVRRAILVRFAQGNDLTIVGRNLGMERCRNVTDDQWRQIIQLVAYMPRQPILTFFQILDIVYPGQYRIVRRVSEPWRVNVYIEPQLQGELRGKFFLNGHEAQLTTGLLTVSTEYPINQVLSVVLDTPLARMGFPGTDFFAGGSFVGTTITLGASPGPIGTPVLVNYGAFTAHHVPADANVEQDADFYPYLSDESDRVHCLLDLVRAAGIEVRVGIKG